MRTVVTFDADEVSLSRAGRPAGRELVARLAAALSGAGLAASEPEQLGGRLWEFDAVDGVSRSRCRVGLVDDAPRTWQVVIAPPAPRGLLRRTPDPADVTLVLTTTHVLDEAIREIEGAVEVRWYDAGDFDRDHGRTWSPLPSAG